MSKPNLNATNLTIRVKTRNYTRTIFESRIKRKIRFSIPYSYRKSTNVVTELNNKIFWWETETFAFVRVPKAILTNPAYKCLSANAALLYGILLDRMSLSVKNKDRFTNRYGDVFVYCTLKDIYETLSCGHDKATKMLKELGIYGLISRLQQGKGRTARIYVHKFIT